jgi:hypothetical protein
MIRRVISTIALLGYLAGQLAVVPHAHGGGAALDGHCWQPHVHVSSPAAGHHHPGHKHSHHAHQRGQGGHHHADDSALDGRTLLHADFNHDADAVYVSSVRQATSRTVIVKGADAEYVSPQPHSSTAIGVVRPTAASPIGIHRAPDTSGYHCALYLSLRTLRI